jgi:hypothetical protein
VHHTPHATYLPPFEPHQRDILQAALVEEERKNASNETNHSDAGSRTPTFSPDSLVCLSGREPMCAIHYIRVIHHYWNLPREIFSETISGKLKQKGRLEERIQMQGVES